MRLCLLAIAAVGCVGPGPMAKPPDDGSGASTSAPSDPAAEPGDPGDSVDADSDDPTDSGTSDPPRRTCTPTTVREAQVFADLMGGVDEETARIALPGPGLAVGDVTGDGLYDVILARPGAPALLFVGDGHGGLERSDTVLPAGETVALGYLNGDAHLDIVLAGVGTDVVLLSEPDGSRVSHPLPQAARHTTTVSVFDADLDGDLDLFAPRHNWPADFEALAAGHWYGDGHALMLNDGTGHFTVDPRGVGDVYGSLAFQGAPVDHDLDGDLDVYINNDFGAWTHPNILLSNDGAGGLAGRRDDGAAIAMFGMGTSVADPSGDGFPDLFVTNIGNLVLLQSLADGTFAEAAAARGLVEFHDERHIAAWGSRFVDLDGDRDDDLVIAYSTVPNEPVERGGGDVPGADDTGLAADRIQQDLVLLHDAATDTFVSAAAAGHTVTDFEGDHGTKALVAADLDSDGRPELIKAGYAADFGDLVLRTYTVSGGCGPGVTLRFSLDAASIGARVEADVDGVRTTRWMLPGATYGSSAAEVYVGAGEATMVERLVVHPLQGPLVDLSGALAGTVIDVPAP